MSGPCFNVDLWAQLLVSKLKGRDIIGVFQSSARGPTLAFLIGWAHAENGKFINGGTMCLPPGYDYNPLGYEDASGKQANFSSLDAGTSAYADRLQHSRPEYQSLAHAIGTDDDVHLGMAPGSDGKYNIAHNVAVGLAMWRSGTTDLSTTETGLANQNYIQNILKAAGQNQQITIGDIVSGDTNPPAGQYSTDPLAAIGNVFSTLSHVLTNPTRLVKGALGLVLIIVGVTLIVKELVPPEVSKAVKVAAMA